MFPILIIIYLVNTCTASGIKDVDKDHLAMFPYCGNVTKEIPQAQGRAINSKDSEKHYRWSVHLIREKSPLLGKSSSFDCSGSIITDR